MNCFLKTFLLLYYQRACYIIYWFFIPPLLLYNGGPWPLGCGLLGHRSSRWVHKASFEQVRDLGCMHKTFPPPQKLPKLLLVHGTKKVGNPCFISQQSPTFMAWRPSRGEEENWPMQVVSCFLRACALQLITCASWDVLTRLELHAQAPAHHSRGPNSKPVMAR